MRVLPHVVLGFCLSACSAGNDAVLAASDIALYEPLPGTSMSAGYLTLRNRSDSAIVLTSVSSPQFERVEMHETITENDVSRMRKIETLRIESGAYVKFAAGGKHLMLIGAREPLAEVSLNFYAGDSLLLTLASDVKKR